MTRRCGADIGKAFSDHYYKIFDSTRAELQTLYKDNSLLSFEAEQFMGMVPIMTKLTVRASSKAAPLPSLPRGGAGARAQHRPPALTPARGLCRPARQLTRSMSICGRPLCRRRSSFRRWRTKS